MLLTLGFPSYAGFSAPSQNAGDMYTKGWDMELGWSDNIGDFWYSVSANLSDYRSKMGYLGDKRTIVGNQIYEEGSHYYEWYMYKTDGLFQTDADLYDADGNKYPTLTPNDKAGNIKYVDVDENGVINADDKVYLGNSQPELLYGGNIAMGWKGFDFNLSFQGIGHQRVLFNSAWIQPLKEQHGAVPELRWVTSGVNTIPKSRHRMLIPASDLYQIQKTLMPFRIIGFSTVLIPCEKYYTLGYTLPTDLGE